MSWTNINNEESGSSIRTKINNAMNALFGELPIAQFWQNVTGQNYIEPVDGKGVVAPDAIFGDQKVRINDDGVRMNYLSFTPGAYSMKSLVIDEEGTVTATPFVSRNVVFADDNLALTLNNGAVMVFLDGKNVQINLPPAANSANAEVIIRLNKTDASYHLTVDASTSSNLWYNDHVNEVQSKQIRTSVKGSWVRIKSTGDIWIVVEDGGTWTYVT